MQAMKSLLNKFAVQNRENLFIFRETSGRFFYMRLFDSGKVPKSIQQAISGESKAEDFSVETVVLNIDRVSKTADSLLLTVHGLDAPSKYALAYLHDIRNS